MKQFLRKSSRHVRELCLRRILKWVVNKVVPIRVPLELTDMVYNNFLIAHNVTTTETDWNPFDQQRLPLYRSLGFHQTPRACCPTPLLPSPGPDGFQDIFFWSTLEHAFVHYHPALVVDVGRITSCATADAEPSRESTVYVRFDGPIFRKGEAPRFFEARLITHRFSQHCFAHGGVQSISSSIQSNYLSTSTLHCQANQRRMQSYASLDGGH